MSDWNKGYQDGMGGAAPPTDSVAYAGWAAGQALRRENEERLRGSSGSDSSPGDVSFAPAPPASSDVSWSNGPTTGPSDPAAAVAGLKGLVIVAALAVFSPITVPAAVTAVIGAPVLMLMLGPPRPPLGRAFYAAFAGFVVYMASVGAAVAMGVALTGSISLDPVTPKIAGAVAIGQVVALAGFAIVSAWWLRRSLPSIADLVRAFGAGVVSLALFLAALLSAAWKLGIA
jgi:hypothetical protein